MIVCALMSSVATQNEMVAVDGGLDERCMCASLVRGVDARR